MSQRVSSKYKLALGRRSFTPVYLVVLDGVPTRFSNVEMTAPLGPTKDYVGALSGAGAQLTIDEGKSSLGNFSFDLLDKNNEVTKLAFQYQLANRQLTVYAGMRGLPESSFCPLFTGRILNYKLASDNVTWKFECVNLLKDEKANIFKGLSKLTADCSAGDATLNVVSTAAFPAATGGVCYLRIGDEAISYTGKTATSFTGCARGQLGSVAAAHTADDEVLNFVVLQGHPLTLALQILTSTGLGTNGPYDTLPACAGLGIAQDLVDIATFEQERDRWLGGWVFRFEEWEKQEAKAFLEAEIYQVCNAYPVVKNDGTISVKVYSPPLPTSVEQEVSDEVLVGAPTLEGNVFDRYFFNEFDLQYDYYWLQDEFLTRELYEDSNSQATFGQVKTKAISSRGVRSSLMTPGRIDRIATRFLKRFSTPAPIVGAKTFYSTRLLQVGDLVPFSSRHIPNLQSGRMGVSGRLYEVIQIDPLYLEGTQKYTLLDTGYSYGKKYGAISPSSKPPINFPVFSAATPAQRNYCFISQKVNNTRGIMGDGTDGYYITA